MNRLILTCLSFCLCFLAPILGQAQGNGVTFYKSYGRENFDLGNDLLVLPDGYLLFGSTEVDQINADATVLRLDANGDVLWQKNFGGPYDDFFKQAVPANDGGFILYGQASNVLTASTEIMLLKLDENGNTVWQKQFGNAQRRLLPTGNIMPVEDGYVLSATSIEPVFSQYEALFMRLKNNGELQWQTEYTPAIGDFSTRFGIYAVTDTALIGGGTSGDGGRLLYLNPDNGFLNRHYKWTAGSGEVYLSDMAPTPNGTFIYAGNRYLSQNGVTIGSALIHKVNARGVVIWTKLVQIPDWLNYTASLSARADGGFFLSLQDGFGHSMLCNFDVDANLIWSREYESGFHYFRDPQVTPDGGFAMAGTRNATSNTPSDMVLLKTDVDGNFGECSGDDKPVLVSNFEYILENQSLLFFNTGNAQLRENNPTQNPIALQTNTICALSTAVPQTENTAHIRIFPNPVSENLYLEVPKAGLSAYSIFDARGGLLYHATTEGVAGQMLSIPLDGIAPGAYLLGLQLADGSRRSALFLRL